jgi:nucleotide-binding universal stress UspA family protein
MPLYPAIPAIGALLCAGVIFLMAPLSQAASASLIALSLLWYAAWGRRHALVRGELAPLLERERPFEHVVSIVEKVAEAERDEVLVPVANPATAKSLTTLAAAFARRREGHQVVALKLVPVPQTTPLSIAQEYVESCEDGHRDALRRAAKHGAVAGVRVKMLLQAAHGIASGILAVAEARPRTRLILLGWRGPMTLERVRASIDKAVVQGAPCDVAVLRDRGLKEIRRILIPAGGGPHARLGLRLAHDLAVGEEAEMVVLRVVLNAGEVDLEAEQHALEHLIRGELGEKDGRVKTRLVVGASSVVAGILAETRRQEYDLLIIGASEEWFLKNWLFGAIPDVVADQAPCSVLLVRKYEPTALSWLRRMRKQPPGLRT